MPRFEDLCRIAVLAVLACTTQTLLADSNWNTLVGHVKGTRLLQTEPVEYGVLYTRIIRLEHSGASNGRLLATYEHFPRPFELFSSDDDGLSWKALSTTPNGHLSLPWTFEGEPHLYELPTQLNDLPAGTLLLAGSAVRDHADGKHLLQRLEIYYSLDHGVTWKYRGLIDQADGVHGSIWEPNVIVAANGHLVSYYSDERLQPKYSQVLALRESADGGLTWKPQQNIVAVPDGKQRPGMAVTQRIGNGKFVMSYEWINGESNPAYLRFSDDGLHWGDPTVRGIPVKTENGSTIGGTPYVIWTPFGGPKGTLVVNARELRHSPNTDREVFLNFNLGAGPWTAMPSPVQWQGNQEFDGWSMGMIPTADGKGIILMSPSYAGKDLNEVLIGRSPLLIPGATYRLINKNSGLVLGVPNGSKVHGTLLQQLTRNDDASQLWRLKSVGDEKFCLINRASGLAVDDYQLKIRNGSPLAVWDANYLPFQQWFPVPTGDMAFQLLNVNANRLLTIWSGSKENGSPIVLWDDDGTPGSEWMLEPLSKP